MHRLITAIATATCMLGAVTQSSATEVPGSNRENVFVMGGVFASGSFGDTFKFWSDHYESNVFAGAGYQYFLYEQTSLFNVGFEAGFGLRMGDRSSAEAWAGVVTRVNIPVGDFVVAPALTAGYSLVTDTIGMETVRAQAINKEVPVLFYLGPEVSISNINHPEWEAFARIQHRSGGYGTIGHIDGSNAMALGLRYKY